MAAPAAPVPSFKGKLYYNSGTYGSPTWVEIGNVGTITPTDERTKQDIQVRNQGGFQVGAIGLRSMSFTTQGVYDPADAAQTAIRAAYNAATPMEFLILDGPSTQAGCAGIRASFLVTKFARLEDITGAMMVDMEFSLAYSANAPAAYTVPTE